jgi:hypothetical protein
MTIQVVDRPANFGWSDGTFGQATRSVLKVFKRDRRQEAGEHVVDAG